MPRSGTNNPPEPRKVELEEQDELQQPDNVPSPLTARELQVREPAKPQPADKPAGERRRTPRP